MNLARRAFALRDPLAWADFAGLVREGERLGYEAVFLPEIAGRDAFVALGALAGETDRLRLATGIAPMTSRRARTTAMAGATVQERSDGRMILGIGTGPPVPGALDGLRGYVALLRDLLGGGTVGDPEPLSLRYGDPVPIWISALGPRSTRLAGEIADGVLLNWCTPERVATAREEVRAGAEAAGRDPSLVTLAVYVRACLGGDSDLAMEALRRATGEYASYPAYARQFATLGFVEETRAAAAAHHAGRPGDVPDALVRAVCVTDASAGERLAACRQAGADLPVVYPVAAGPDVVASIRGTLRAIG